MNRSLKLFKNQRTISLLIFFGLILIWELSASHKWIDPIFTGQPTRIISEGVELLQEGKILRNLLESLMAFLSGIALAVLFGVIVGLVVGSNSTAKKIVGPYVYGLNTMPQVALIPVAIIIIGANLRSEILIIFIMAAVPVLINTIESVGTVDTKLVKMAQSFGATRGFILRQVVFFHSLPFIFSGIRMALGKGLIALIIAELYGLGRGIGYLISFYGNTLQINRLFFIISLIVIFNYGLIRIITFFEHKVRRTYGQIG